MLNCLGTGLLLDRLTGPGSPMNTPHQPPRLSPRLNQNTTSRRKKSRSYAMLDGINNAAEMSLTFDASSIWHVWLFVHDRTFSSLRREDPWAPDTSDLMRDNSKGFGDLKLNRCEVASWFHIIVKAKYPTGAPAYQCVKFSESCADNT